MVGPLSRTGQDSFSEKKIHDSEIFTLTDNLGRALALPLSLSVEEIHLPLKMFPHITALWSLYKLVVCYESFKSSLKF